ncbi:MAG: hypothetical protein ABJC12_14395 [Saprospiraceae bacterium]
MKMPHFVFTAIIFFCFNWNMNAQDIHLTSGHRAKTIKTNSLVKIHIPYTNTICCTEKVVYGRVISFENGIIRLQKISLFQPLLKSGINVGHTVEIYKGANDQNIAEISIDSIYSITKHPVNKDRKRSTAEGLGLLITLFGLSHVLAAPVAELKEDNSGAFYLFLGLGEIAVGTAVTELFRNKPIVTNEKSTFYKGEGKIWKLN